MNPFADADGTGLLDDLPTMNIYSEPTHDYRELFSTTTVVALAVASQACIPPLSGSGDHRANRDAGSSADAGGPVECRETRLSHDVDGDGTGEITVVSNYDDAGQLERRRVYFAPDQQEEPDAVVQFEHDADGNLTRVERDGPHEAESRRPQGELDGQVDERWTHRYESDRRVRTEYDSVGGGSDGRLPDGEPDEVTTYEYDDDGRLVRRRTDGFATPTGRETPLDDEPDTIVEYTYEDGVQVRSDFFITSVEGDRPQYRTTYTYEGDRRVREEVDLGNESDDGFQIDGTIDEVVIYNYDDRGNVTEKLYYTSRPEDGGNWTDGPPAERVEFEYDCD